MLRALIPLFFIYSLAAEAVETVKFFYPADLGGPLTCNGAQQTGNIPIECQFNNAGTLTVSLDPWGWEGTAILHENSNAISGFCSGSVIPDSNLSDAYQLNPDCLASDAPPPPASGTKLVDEWYSDLPWHQKLSTVDSNLIDQPFVLPFDALPKNIRERPECKDEARCMLRYGVVNVVSMHRTDTLYQNNAPTKENCMDGKCVEVKLDIYRYHTQNTAAEPQPEEIRSNSLGFGINEATIFAPWRPWYTGHYCGVTTNQNSDAVCYDDYFTTELIAATPRTKSWVKDFPAFFWPRGEQGTIFEKYCAKKGEENKDNSCTMYLGKINWKKNAKEPEVVACDLPMRESIGKCQQEVNARTAELDKRFNTAITSYPDIGRYPWNEAEIGNLAAGLDTNPFIGYYELERYSIDGRTKFSLFKQPHYALPKQCAKKDYLGARQGKPQDIEKLEDCVLNFEIHTNGFFELWKDLYGGTLPLSDNIIAEIKKALPGTDANQYGRTMFMYAGVPEQHIAASFKVLDDGLSIYDKIYNASIYTQYLPMVNPGDQTLAERFYTDNFWHAILMSNHMNQTPDHFIRGIRGRALWHNEYRANLMYLSEVQGNNKGTNFEKVLGHVDFPAGFQVEDSTSPFHGNTCDSCHIRNGSGVPLMPNGRLPQIHVNRGMKPNYTINRDYTYSNKELPSMKMVLFDLNDDSGILEKCDDDDHTATKPSSGYYNNKIMNFFGNSLHVNQNNKLPTYQMVYVDINGNDGFEIVDQTRRGNSTLHPPKRIEISNINTGSSCRDIVDKPKDVDSRSWPASCGDVSGAMIEEAIENHEIGFMHLLGRRLGNTPMIEMIPDETILESQRLQSINGIPSGCYSLSPGTRSGRGGKTNYRNCSSGQYGTGKQDCYIGRWGWIGDRASLEDQIANAANVEMNLTSKDSYNAVHPSASSHSQLVRYNETLCGPADENCRESPANSDITEQEIRDMATYQRWIGIPNRSEYQVSSHQVQQGEDIFKDLQCNSCHVIKKIAFDHDDNVLPDEERDHLRTLEIVSGNRPEYPFISYLGTDLLMHDMGYLSQVAKAPADEKIRNQDCTVKEQYKNHVQKIRTPALKGLRFNRFVTDSNHNTTSPIGPKPPNDDKVVPGCDFLLHDGRACDAIEAAYLHDGPAIKDLKMIEGLNNLNPDELDQLRAFLYSL